MTAEATENAHSKATKVTLQTLPDDEKIPAWINMHKTAQEVCHVEHNVDEFTDEETFVIVSSFPSKEADPAWPIFVGYPFVRTVKDYNLRGQFVGTHLELITDKYYAQLKNDGNTKFNQKARPIPLELKVIAQDIETQCVVCVRKDVYGE